MTTDAFVFCHREAERRTTVSWGHEARRRAYGHRGMISTTLAVVATESRLELGQ